MFHFRHYQAVKSSVLGQSHLHQLLINFCYWPPRTRDGKAGERYPMVDISERAKAAEFLVRSWMEEVYPGINKHIVSYIIGLDSLKATSIDEDLPRDSQDIRLRMDGLFENKEQAIHFTKEFTALYTNGPAAGGGISTGHKKEIILEKALVKRKDVQWHITAARNKITQSDDLASPKNITQTSTFPESVLRSLPTETTLNNNEGAPQIQLSPAPHDRKIPLYDFAHSRAGDKGDDINFSLIPYFPPDIERLKKIVTQEWVKKVVSSLLNASPFPTSDDIERETNGSVNMLRWRFMKSEESIL